MRRSTDLRNSINASSWWVLRDWHGNQRCHRLSCALPSPHPTEKLTIAPWKLSEERTEWFLVTNSRYLWQHKKKRQNKTQHPHKDIFKINFKKIEPSIDHQSSWCLTKKYLELSQLYLKCPGYETIIVLLFRYLLTTVGTTDVEWQASENCNEVGTNSF